MEYHYLTYDGPDCSNKVDIRHGRSSGDWITIVSSEGVNHLCSQECLIAFANEPAENQSDRIADQFASIVGVELSPFERS